MHRQGRLRKIRSLFVSDVHLGCRFAHADAFLEFLNAHEPECLYLVGDFIDGWRLRRSWHWTPVYSRILRRLLELSENGTLLRYAPGNHDNFLRHFLVDLGFLEIQDEFLHQAIDGRRFVVLHGDQFDTIELRSQWLSVLGSYGYDLLLWCNGRLNQIRGWLGRGPSHFAATIKRRVKSAVTFVSNFEQRLADHARANDCHGVICGHVHTAAHGGDTPIAYFNTGDWVESCTALAEYSDGSWELIHLPLTPSETCPVSWPRTSEASQELAAADELSSEATTESSLSPAS